LWRPFGNAALLGAGGASIRGGALAACAAVVAVGGAARGLEGAGSATLPTDATAGDELGAAASIARCSVAHESDAAASAVPIQTHLMSIRRARSMERDRRRAKGGRVKRALVVALLVAASGCREKKAPPVADEPSKDVVHTPEYDEGPVASGEVEPWPAKGYEEAKGGSPFGVLAHGHHIRLAHIGASFFVHDFPHLFSLAAGKLRELPAIQRTPATHNWGIERIGGTPSHLVVEIDEPRREVMPTHARIRYTLDGGAWHGEPVEFTASSWSYRTLTWADGRILDVREGSLDWISPSKPAALDFGPPGKGCAHAYRYLDDTVVVGTTTWVFGLACTDPARVFVTHFAAGDDHASPFVVAPGEIFQPRYAVGKNGTVLIAGDCPPEGKHLGEGCYATIDDDGWHRIDGPEGLSPQSVAIDGDGAFWLVVGASGDFTGRSFGRRGPAPLGEVYRRPPDGGAWERVAMPADPLKGWDERRFVAETVAADGDDVYLAGFYYYTMVPSPGRARTARRFAILRRGQKGPATELDRKE
jgi:hypothetical protein